MVGPTRSRRLLLGAAVAAVMASAATACSDGSDAAVAPDPDRGPVTSTTAPARGCGADPAALVERDVHQAVEIDSGGAARTYDRFVPERYDGDPTPLVVDLHGYTSGAQVQEAISGLGEVAAREGFVVATPQGSTDLAYWNAVPLPDRPDDVAFVRDVIDDVAEVVCVDPARVYVQGFSNGAFLASLLACDLSDRVAAIATVAGLVVPDGCDPARPVPVVAVHGTADEFVPVDGGRGPALDAVDMNDDSRAVFEAVEYGPVVDAAATWAGLDGCDPEPARRAVAPDVGLTEYGGCDAGATVALYVADAGGHTWPGSDFTRASASLLGPTTDGISATEVFWDFFVAHPMP